jgi:Methyltransferase domain
MAAMDLLNRLHHRLRQRPRHLPERPRLQPIRQRHGALRPGRRLATAAGAAAVAALVAGMGTVHAQAPDLDVPFITTPDEVTLAMLRLAGVTARDHVIDLGSGDGRIVITAARRFGASGLGVEIVPELVARSRANAERAGVAARARFEEQDLFKTELAAASVITMYLLPEVNLQLRPRLMALKPGTRIVSHDWDLGDWAPDQTHTVPAPDKPVGREKLSRLHLWVVPAPVAGLWCAAHGPSLLLEQRHQTVGGRVGGHGSDGPRDTLAQGALQGGQLRLVGATGAMLRATWSAQPLPQLKVTQAQGAWRGLQDQTLRPAANGRCG